MLHNFFAGLVVFSFVVGQLIRLDIFGVQFPLLDAAVFLFVAYSIISKQFSWKKYFQQKYLLIFIICLVFSNVVNLSRYTILDNIKGNLYFVRFIVYSLATGIVGETRSSASLQRNKIIIMGLIIASIGILQFIFYPSFEYLKYQQWDEHLNRLAFPYLDPSFTGQILLIFLITLINCGQTRRFVPTITNIGLISLAIFFTFSRAAWLNAGIIGGIMFISRKKLISTAIIILIFVFFIVGTGLMTCPLGRICQTLPYGNKLNRTETIASRLQSIQKGLAIWQKNPIFGVGFNQYKNYQLESINSPVLKQRYIESHGLSSVENSFVFILATSGILGFGAFLLWILNELWKLQGVKKYIFLSILIGSLFNNVFFYPFILMIIFSGGLDPRMRGDDRD